MSLEIEGRGRARYVLLEAAYFQVVTVPDGREGRTIECALLDAGAEIYFDGPPAHYMAPRNEPARAMWEKHEPTHLDPIEAIPLFDNSPGITL